MKIARFKYKEKINFGILDGEKIHLIEDISFRSDIDNCRDFKLTGTSCYIEDVSLLAPCSPRKYIGVGFNYAANAEAFGLPLPTYPIIFLKPPTTVIGPGQDIVLPRDDGKVIAEGELAVVIGRTCKNVHESEASSYILGFTITNDLTNLSQFEVDEGNPTRSKAHDTFSPLGPVIETEIDYNDLDISSSINGVRFQNGNIHDMIFGIKYCVSYISRLMTLLPGDVIATGAPPVSSEVVAGDIVEVEINGIGILQNGVRREA